MLAVQREQDEGPRGSNRLPASCDIVRMPGRTHALRGAVKVFLQFLDLLRKMVEQR
jgi:hypothetical protein